MGVAERQAMNRNVDPRREAVDLIKEHGFEAAAAYAVDRIAELHDGGDMYDLSVWRAIRKAIRDFTTDSDEADRQGEPDDDG
jgi:hypothetical protein